MIVSNAEIEWEIDSKTNFIFRTATALDDPQVGNRRVMKLQSRECPRTTKTANKLLVTFFSVQGFQIHKLRWNILDGSLR
jgi:hypothetical protein